MCDAENREVEMEVAAERQAEVMLLRSLLRRLWSDRLYREGGDVVGVRLAVRDIAMIEEVLEWDTPEGTPHEQSLEYWNELEHERDALREEIERLEGVLTHLEKMAADLLRVAIERKVPEDGGRMYTGQRP